MRETLFVRSPNQMENHKLCLLSTPTSSQPEGPTTSLQSIDDNGTPATWTFGLVFQQAIDRQDRTQTEGRFSLLEPLETQPSQDSLPLL